MGFGGRVETYFTVPSGVLFTVVNSGGTTAVSVAAGSYTQTSFIAYLQSALTAQRPPAAGAWVVTLSTGTSGTGLVTIATTSGTYSVTVWTSTALRDMLGFTGTISTQVTQTGTLVMRGLWLPDCPLNLDGDPSRAPRVTDLRTTTSPTGDVVGLVGNSRYRHKNVRWSHVPQANTWEAVSSTKKSYETWFTDTQFGMGHAWFLPTSAMVIYWNNAGTDTAVGSDLSATGPTTGWRLSGVNSIEPRKVHAAWTGVFEIVWPTIESSG